MNKKGMSPIIAAVILIAATMSIAGILAYWTTGFVKTQLVETEGVTGGPKCIGAEFELRPESSLEGNTLHFILDNRKPVDLHLTGLYLINSDNTVENYTFEDPSLQSNEIKDVTVTIKDPEFLTGEIKTQCSDVSVFFTYDQVAG